VEALNGYSQLPKTRYKNIEDIGSRLIFSADKTKTPADAGVFVWHLERNYFK